MTLLFYFRFITIDSYGEFATINLIDTNFHNSYGEFDPGSE